MKNKEQLNNSPQFAMPRALGDTDVLPRSRFGVNRRKAMKSVELANQNETLFTEQEGFQPIKSAVLAPSAEESADLRRIVISTPEVFHMPQDKQLQAEINEAKKQLAAEKLMLTIADKLGSYVSEEESGSVVLGLREAKQTQTGYPDIGISRHWQGDLRSGVDMHNVRMRAKWSMGGQLIALGYDEANFFLADEESTSQALLTEKFQIIIDYKNDVVLYGGVESDRRLLEERDASGSMSTHKIASFLENPDTKVIRPDVGGD